MRGIGVLIGLLFGISVCAAEYDGTMRMGSGYTLEKVRVKWDEHGSITLYHVKFARLMPVRVDVVIPQVQALIDSGQTVLSGDNIVPTVNEKAYPDRIITNLHGQADMQTISFRCLFGGKEMRFDGKSVIASPRVP